MGSSVGEVKAAFWYSADEGMLRIFSQDPQVTSARPIEQRSYDDLDSALRESLKQVIGRPNDEYGLIELHDCDSHETQMAGYDRRAEPCAIYLPTKDTWSELEELVFAGEFSFGLKAVIWKQHKMDEIGREGSSPEHDRIQNLMALYSMFSAGSLPEDKGRLLRQKAEGLKEKYKEKYNID